MRDILAHGRGRTLFGQPVQQSWGSLFVIEHMLATYRPDFILELGTGAGLLTWYWRGYAAAADRFPHIITVDLPQHETIAECDIAIDYQYADISKMNNLAPHVLRLANEATRPYVLCDAWDPKSDQVNLIAPLLKQGALISAHDYWTRRYGDDPKPRWCFEDKDIDWRFVKPHQELNEMGVRFKTRMLWLRVQEDKHHV